MGSVSDLAENLKSFEVERRQPILADLGACKKIPYQKTRRKGNQTGCPQGSNRKYLPRRT
jgi:hypothetical protein